MFLELKVWKFWGFCKFLNLDKRVDLNLERLNLGVIVLETVDFFGMFLMGRGYWHFKEWFVVDGYLSSDFELLHCSFKGGFIEILVEFWNSYFS